MKFKLTMSTSFYTEDADIIRDYLNLGFVIDEDEYYPPDDPERHIWRPDKEIFIEINTLDEIMAFIDKFGAVVMFSGEIEIYNGYRE